MAIRHIIPVDDLKAHTTDTACDCGPSVEILQGDDRPIGVLVAHNAYDKRHLSEYDHKCTTVEVTG